MNAAQNDNNDGQAGWIFTIDGCDGEPQGGGMITYVPEGDKEEFEQLLMDSGAFARVCPYRHAEEYPLMGRSEELTLRSVTGKRTQVHGIREVDYDSWDSSGTKRSLKIKFYVADVRRAIVATSKLLDKGFSVVERPTE